MRAVLAVVAVVLGSIVLIHRQPTLAAEGETAVDAATAAGPVQTGSFQLTFDERSPLSAAEEIGRRMGWNVKDRDYDLADETFEVYVPASYTGQEPYGLLVWVCPGPGGQLFDRWREVIDKHKLIWVGPNNVGNNRNPVCRLGLAIDAAHNTPKRFNIDPERIYISGLSGGGRVTSMLSIGFPDVFRGGYALIGCNYYRDVHLPGQRDRFYRRSFLRPAGKLLIDAKKHRRHVLLTGDDDANRLQTKLNYEAARRDGFKHVSYFQVPAMGHEPPDAEWFERGLVALDEPIDTGRNARRPQGKTTTAARTSGAARKKRAVARP